VRVRRRSCDKVVGAEQGCVNLWCPLYEGAGSGSVVPATTFEQYRPARDEIFAGAVVAGRGVSATIVSTESAATVSAGRDALQQRATFSQRAP
jgi:hypothetical protein